MICPTYEQNMQQTTLKKDPWVGISQMTMIIILTNNDNNTMIITIFITLFQCLRDLAPAEDIR